MEQELEHTFTCHYCGSETSMLLDPTASQEYVEDCEVCCKPIQIRYTCGDGEIITFEAVRDDD
jgi:transcription elongation factor Elf1